MRALVIVAAVVILAAAVAWGPALVAPVEAAAGGCAASGVAFASCSFSCREGEAVTIVVETGWGWGLSRPHGEAQCGSLTKVCDGGRTTCTGGAGRIPITGEGECRAAKEPMWGPGYVTVRCRSQAPSENGTARVG